MFQAYSTTYLEEEKISQKEIHPALGEHLSKIMNVGGDGNCGFRAVAECLGNDSEEWPRIREELKEQIQARRELYSRLATNTFGQRIEHLIQRLTCNTSPAPFSKWMQFPDMGDLIANTYSRPVFFFSLAQNLTFFPFSCSPNNNPPICLCFWSQTAHFVGLSMKEGIFPVGKLVSHWKNYCSPLARRWEKKYSQHLEMGLKKLYPEKNSDVVLDISSE